MIRLAVIGTGGMGRGHIKALGAMRGCRVVACCDTAPGKAERAASELGVPAAYADVDRMLGAEDLHAVTVAASDRAHCEASLKAIARGLHVLCEKPLAATLGEARRMAKAAAKAGVLTAVNFSYRNSPATQKAAALVRSGRIGRVMHVEGAYLQSWLTSRIWGNWRTTPSMLWRLSTRHGSMGVLGDLGVHLYDLACFVVGEFSELSCALKTFDKGVPAIGEYVLDANDSMLATVRFKNGALGTLHSSRWATGHVNTVMLRVHGDSGAVDLNLDRAPESRLKFWSGRTREWRDVPCPPAPDMFKRFVTSIRTGRQGQTCFAGGALIQSYLDASLRAADTGGFVRPRKV